MAITTTDSRKPSTEKSSDKVSDKWKRPSTKQSLHSRLSVLKHDEHSLDLKLLLQGKENRNFYSVSAYFFFPRAFHVREDGKSSWSGDFQSRVRFSLPQDDDNLSHRIYYSFTELEFLVRLANEQDLSDEMDENAHDLIKDLGFVIGERLRSFLQEALNCAADLDLNSESAKERQDFFAKLKRDIRVKEGFLKKVHHLWDLDQKRLFPLLTSLRDFVFFRWFEIHYQLQEMLTPLSEEESLLVGRNLSDFSSAVQFCPNHQSPEEAEKHFLYLSHLKKFFQSEMFVETQQHDNLKKLNEPMAAIGAGAAALSVATFELFSRQSWETRGLLVVAVGTVLYVLKDRAKDKIRGFLTGLIGKHISDFKHYLKTKGKPVGVFHVWLRILSKKAVPSAILRLRQQQCHSEVEAHLDEDVLHYKKEIRVFTEDMATKHMALYDTIRVNFNRVLKYLDDPDKNFVELKENGELTKIGAHRIYSATLVVHEIVGARSSSLWSGHLKRQTTIKTEKLTSYRLIFDKRGLISVR
jgi:hypothetical protein